MKDYKFLSQETVFEGHVPAGLLAIPSLFPEFKEDFDSAILTAITDVVAESIESIKTPLKGKLTMDFLKTAWLEKDERDNPKPLTKEELESYEPDTPIYYVPNNDPLNGVWLLFSGYITLVPRIYEGAFYRYRPKEVANG